MLLIQQSLGIEIREGTVRVVLLGKTLRGMVLVDHFIKEYPGLLDRSREGDFLDEIVRDLRSFISDHTKPNDVILGIPRQKVILREIKLPILGQQELEDIISYEIEKHIPLPSQDIYYDYQVIEKVSETEQNILLGIIKKEDLDFYLMILERAELIPALATPLCYALKDCPGFDYLRDQELGLLVDLGERELEMDLLKGNRLIFSRNLSINIKDNKIDDELLMGQIEESLEGDIKDEEKADPYTRSLGSGVLWMIRQWLRMRQSPLNNGLPRVALTGLGTFNTTLSDYLHNWWGMDVYIPNPFQGLTEKKISGRKASALAMATGLAKKGLQEKFTDLNLLPLEMRVSRRSNALAFTVIFIALLFLILTITAYTGFGRFNEFYLPKRYKLKMLVNMVNQLQENVKQVKELSESIERLAVEVDEIETFIEGRISKLDILKELSEIIPNKVWLDRANIDNENIQLNGFADTSSILIGILEDSPFFENVIFPSTITKRGREMERFRIKADIQKGLKDEQ